MTQGGGMGREVRGGFRMGNTCTPMVIHVNVWQNQYNIVKKINIKTVFITVYQNVYKLHRNIQNEPHWYGHLQGWAGGGGWSGIFL